MKKVTIDSFEAACQYEGISPQLPDLSNLPKGLGKAVLAFTMLAIIGAAKNRQANNDKPWEPVYDGSEAHWFPYFYRGDESGSGFRFFCSDFGGLYSTVGSRLELISEEVSDDMAATFPELYRDLHVIPALVPTAEPAAQAAE